MKNIILKFTYFLVLLLCGCQKQNDGFTSQLAESITPPFQNILKDGPKVLEFNAEEGKTIQLASGSSVVVKPNSFLDSKGNVVKGNVKLEFKEFSSAADIVTSGIPMTFQDQNGENQHMQSAGMFELKGTANGEEISIAENKPLQVNMASGITGKYDFFYLEKESSDKLGSKGTLFPTATAQSAPLQDQKYKWVKLTKNEDEKEEAEDINLKKTPFNLKFDVKSYPETKYLDSLTWAYSGDKETDNPLSKENKWVLNEKWNSVEVGKPVYGSIKNESKRKRKPYYSIHYSDYIIEIELDRKILYTLNNAIYGRKIRQHTFVYGMFTKQWNHLDSLIILDLKTGRKKSISISMECFNNGDFDHILSFNENEDKFVLRCNSTLSVYDLSGNLLKTSDEFNGLRSINYLPYKDQFIMIELERGKVKVWDWKNNKIVFNNPQNLGYYAGEDESDTKPRHKNFSKYNPVLILGSESKNYFLVNWENNTLKKINIPDSTDWISFLDRCSVIYTYQYTHDEIYSNGKFTSIYDLQGNLIYKNPFNKRSLCYIIGKTFPAPFIVEDSNSFILFNADKKKIDLKKTDPLIKQVFTNSENLITYSTNGFLTIWDSNTGAVKNHFPINPLTEESFICRFKDGTIGLFHETGNIQLADTSGKILAEFNKTKFFATYFMDVDLEQGEDFDYEKLISYSGWKVNTSYKLPKKVYRLSLYGDTTEFHTYIYGDKKTLSAIDNYKRGLKQRLAKVKEAKENEDKLIRSFEINKFGIYNWDIFYDKSDVVTIKADFELDNDSFNQNASAKQVFLITGQDRNVVIKNPDFVWDKFQFNPKDPNMLLMVLPDNRIAVLSEDEFSKINVQDLTKTGKYTFKLKVLDRIQSKEQLENILKSNANVNS